MALTYIPSIIVISSEMYTKVHMFYTPSKQNKHFIYILTKMCLLNKKKVIGQILVNKKNCRDIHKMFGPYK